MKGTFLKRSRLLSFLWATFFIITGTFVAVRFGTWGIDAVIESKIAEAIFCFGFALLGIGFGCMSILIFNFNRNASFETDGKRIQIACGLGECYDLNIDDVFEVSLQGNNLLLTTEDKRIIVSHLENRVEICEYLNKIVAKKVGIFDLEKEEKKLTSLRKKLIKRAALVAVAALLLFVHIGWCVYLNEGCDLGEFSDSDDMVFVAFAAAEVITLTASLLLAKWCGKVTVMFEESKKRVNIARAQQHRKDSLEKYEGIISVKYFDGGSYRIVIFSPNGDIFGYMLEIFDVKTERWSTCYEKAKGFRILSELYDDIEETFSDVILED